MLSQGLEIQANTLSRASLLACRLEERQPPSLVSWPPAWVLQWKPLWRGIRGAKGFAGGSSGEMLRTSCPASPREGLTVGNVGAIIWLPHCKDIPPLKLPCKSMMFEPFLEMKVHPSNPGASAYSIATGCCSKHPSHICMLRCSGVPAYLEGE